MSALKTYPNSQWQKASARWLAVVMCCFILVALLADFIANDLPLYAKIDDQHHLPAFSAIMANGSSSAAFDYSKAQVLILPIIPFSTNPSEGIVNRYEPPFVKTSKYGRNVRHLLGTDRLGRDVAACMVHGCRKSLLVALLSMIIAACIGMSIGLLAGYWGNSLRIKRPWLLGGWLLVSMYVGYLFVHDIVSSWIWVCLLLVTLLLLLPKITSRSLTAQGVPLPLDDAVQKSIELFQAVPSLLILLVLSSLLSNPSLWQLGIIIGVLGWSTLARFMRGEVLNIKNLPYVVAARISGLSHGKIMMQYILPQALGPLLVVFAFGIASVVVLESTLSFLGIGVPTEEVTWGTLLSQAKTNTKAWWLAIFPGLTIFILVTVLQLSGDHIKQRLNPED